MTTLVHTLTAAVRPWLHGCKKCFILHVTISKNVLKMFYGKTFAKMLQNIFSRIEHGLKMDSGYV